MSSKQLKKLLRLREQQQQLVEEDHAGGEGDGDESGEDESTPVAQRPRSAFLMAMDDIADSDDPDAEEEPEQKEDGDDEPQAQALSESPPLPAASGKKKRKKKKQDKHDRNKQPSPSPSPSASPHTHAHTDEIDAAIEELDASATASASAEDAMAATTTATHTKQRQQQQPSCLSMEKAAFNPDNELKRIFGASVVARTQGADQQQQRGRARGRQRAHYSQVVQAKWRRMWLQTGEETWPPAREGLEMHMLGGQQQQHGEGGGGGEGGSAGVEFKLVANSRYQSVQEQFYECVETHDPNALVDLISREPFHVDALLQLSEIYRAQSENETAFDLCKRALYALEWGFHPKFSPFVTTPGSNLPQVRVSSALPESIPLYHALGSYMLGLGSQGVHRTALEVAKLLLAMDMAADRFHTLLHIDFYAIRSRSYAFLHRFAFSFIPQHVKHLQQGPRAPTPTLSSTSHTSSSPLPAAGPAPAPTAAAQPQPTDNTHAHLTSADGVADGAGGEGEGEGVVELCRLDWMLPNFAFSMAMAALMENTSGVDVSLVKSLTIDRIVAWPPTDLQAPYTPPQSASDDPSRPLVCLCRALLLFPSFLHEILDHTSAKAHNKVPGSAYVSKTWGDLLFARPFGDAKAAKWQHRTHGDVLQVMVACYVAKSGALWKAEQVQRVLHSCAGHLAFIYADLTDTAGELDAFRTSWCASRFAMDMARYRDLRPSEFAQRYTLPDFILQQRIPARRGQQNGMGDGERGNVSLDSNPVVVFLQTLLPWNQIDQTGLHAQPVNLPTMQTLLARLRDALARVSNAQQEQQQQQAAGDAAAAAGGGGVEIDAADAMQAHLAELARQYTEGEGEGEGDFDGEPRFDDELDQVD